MTDGKRSVNYNFHFGVAGTLATYVLQFPTPTYTQSSTPPLSMVVKSQLF